MVLDGCRSFISIHTPEWGATIADRRTPEDHDNERDHVVCFAKVLEQLKSDIVYVDAADVKAEHFGENLRRQYAKISPAHAKKIEIISMHQADAIYPVVSAASIIAKVRRDELIEELKKEWNADFGSGYPADPKTKEFLLKWGKEHGGKFPEIVRQS